MVEQIVKHRAERIPAWQLKVGERDVDLDILRIRAAAEGVPNDRIVADAQTGWLARQALLVLDAARDVGVAVEQPCLLYGVHLAVPRPSSSRFVLDECIDGVDGLDMRIGRRSDGGGKHQNRQAAV